MDTRSNTVTLLVSIFLTVCVSFVLSCTCQKRHPQQHVCDADFVIRGTVLGRSRLPAAGFAGQYEFRIQVQKIFKGREYGIGEEAKLITPSSEALCGVPMLRDGQTYAITGKLRDDQMQISVCGWVSEWESVTRSQRQGLKHMYQRYCSKCPIRISTPARSLSQGPLDYFRGCSYNPYTPYQLKVEDCEGAYSSCVRNSDGGCNWLTNSSYKECHEERQTKIKSSRKDQKTGVKRLDNGVNW